MSQVQPARRVPWFLWPLVALSRLVALIITLTGRLVAIVLGFVFIVAGALLTVTVVGAVLGIPLALFGAMLVVRGLF